MLELHVNQPTDADAVVLVKWCLSKEIRDELIQNNAHDARILLVDKSGRNEKRYLFPLNDLAAYINFSHPGEHTLYATILWGDNSKRYLDSNSYGSFDDHSEFCFYGHSQYDHSFRYEYDDLCGKFLEQKAVEENIPRKDVRLSREEDLVATRSAAEKAYQAARVGIGQAELSLSVDARFFAPPRPAWEKKWVNFVFKGMDLGEPKDQCSYRRRGLFAFLVQLWAILIWLVVATLLRASIGLFHLLCLRTGLRFGALLHPFRTDFDEIYYRRGAYLLKDKINQDSRLWLMAVPFTPIVLVIGFGTLMILKAFGTDPFYAMSALQIFLALLGGLVAVTIIIALICVIGVAIVIGINKLLKIKQPERKQPAVPTKSTLQLDEALICTGILGPVTLQALPRHRRSVKLRFQEVKAKICRPFAI